MHGKNANLGKRKKRKDATPSTSSAHDNWFFSFPYCCLFHPPSSPLLSHHIFIFPKHHHFPSFRLLLLWVSPSTLPPLIRIPRYAKTLSIFSFILSISSLISCHFTLQSHNSHPPNVLPVGLGFLLSLFHFNNPCSSFSLI